MTEEQARDILKECIRHDNSLKCLADYVNWEPGDDVVVLDGNFILKELQAIAWWMENMNDES